LRREVSEPDDLVLVVERDLAGDDDQGAPDATASWLYPGGVGSVSGLMS
jgi:hypothetical protein